MEAAAKGFSSKDESFSFQSGPRSSSSTFYFMTNKDTAALSSHALGISLRVGTYRHLPGGHKVCALPHPLKDLLQLRVDEGVVWKPNKLSGKQSRS